MIVCQTCHKEINRPDLVPTDGVSHGLCLPCFVVRFEDVEQQSLAHLASHSIEQLPMGTILLDADLRVAGYNAAETRVTGLPADQVLGRKFFVEIAPCMAAPAVGVWCAEHLHGVDVVRKDVEWALRLREGVRLASLSLFAGRGRVAITITLTPLEIDELPPPRLTPA